MLLRCFGLNDDPFGVTPEPRFLYQSNTHREALAGLKCGYYANRGFSALIADPGLGKTTLLQCFLGDIRNAVRSAFLFNIDGQCQPRELISSILRDLKIAPAGTTAAMYEQLNTVLAEEARLGRSAVVVVDEAQNLSDAALESLRLLSNFETTHRKLLYIILAGQSQLSERLENPVLVQLRQRITTVCRLDRLSTEEIRAYINRRLAVAGYCGEPLFTDEAIAMVSRASQGIPQTINTLCFNSLLICRALNDRQVVGSMVEEVIGDLQLSPRCNKPALPISSPCGYPSVVDRKSRPVAKLIKRWSPTIVALLLVSLGALVCFGNRWLSRAHKAVKTSPDDSKALPLSESNVVKSSPIQLVALTQLPFKVEIAPHQTLREIALKYLGEFNEKRLQQIRALNPMLTNPNHIVPGQSIWLPGPPTSKLSDFAVHTN
jgi:type II secretory pathway predicted ATPase ExeA